MSDTGLDALRIDLAALRRKGIDRHAVAVDLPQAWLAEALAETDATVTEGGRVQLDVMLQPRGVIYVTGSLTVAFEVPCGRCLEPAAVAEKGRLVATYLPSAEAAARTRAPVVEDEDGEDDGTEDADTWTYDGTILSLEPMVAEHVALAYPMRALCARGVACRGLCSNCGADLNVQTGLSCTVCGNPVPQTPEADPPSADDASDPAAGPDEAPNKLADALRKLMS